jgi:glycosyltransferase involved in cell wall biosynthesis
MKTPIPRRIIQTGKEAPTSLRIRAMVSNLRILNPDFEYLFFDDSDVEKLIDKEFPQYRTVIDSFRYRIQRYDFFRYLAVYHYGGFYFDLDVLTASGLAPLLDYGCVFSFEGLTYSRYLRSQYNMDWEIGNFAFGATPGHPFIGAIIENCVRAQKDPEWLEPMMQNLPRLSKSEFYVLYTTGPGLVTRTLVENPELGRSVKILFPDDVCNFDNWNRFGNFGIHLMDASWRPKTGRVLRRITQYFENRRCLQLTRESRAFGIVRQHNYDPLPEVQVGTSPVISGNADKPLVSILIPAHNVEEWIADAIRSALEQTWENKEIIVVDDGSSDRTYEIASRFATSGVKVLRQEKRGAAAARNKALSLSHGEYIQWFDADDLLARDKITKQMALVKSGVGKRTLLSGAWGMFMYRPKYARFTPTELWNDLSPVEWLVRKMGRNLYMQTATWLVSRELTDAAGPWNERLLTDDDGEYFCRVLLASEGVRFVPDSKMFYRSFGYTGLGYMGSSNEKIDSHWISMKLHIRYLRSLEQSKRIDMTCLRYLRAWLIYFYPERSEIIKEANELAAGLGESLGKPELSWKYSWLQKTFGWSVAKVMQRVLRRSHWMLERRLDRILLTLTKQ